MKSQTKELLKLTISSAIGGTSYISVWMALKLMSDMQCEGFRKEIQNKYYVSEIKRREDLKKIDKLNFVTRIGSWSTGVTVGSIVGANMLKSMSLVKH